ncbi:MULTISPECIES: ATP-binding protein [Devosia]|uniref:ATP-binding protein n=1 Tax=Devosia sediminis TaxID=2798801 RepID=A0A934MG64_9HYPH|nr:MULTISPECIES: ATP-binding protein [Devosia]MBJ3783617.1 ATP-binding protein [Devosia sediminis]UYO00860.1 MAG: ATP-binding protein [Devosia sp.]
MTKTLTNSEILAVFRKLRVKHPRLDIVTEVCDDLRATITDDEPKQFGTLFAPSHVGKSTAVKNYQEKVAVPEAISRGLVPADLPLDEQVRLQKLVVHVTLEGGATPRSLCADILAALGDPRSARGSKNLMLRRVYDLLSTLGVELLVIDEIQHLAVSKHRMSEDAALRSIERSRTSEVTDTLKAMLIRGVVPMLFVGIEEARPYLLDDIQLALRCHEEIDFGELSWEDTQERQVFQDFVGRLGIHLAKEGLFPQRADFLNADIPAALHEASLGRLGIACRIVAKACMHAAKAKADTVTREHLSKAVDTFAIPRGIVKTNPFKRGGDARLVAA